MRRRLGAPGAPGVQRKDRLKAELLSVRVDAGLMQILKAEASREGLTVSELVRRRLRGRPGAADAP